MRVLAATVIVSAMLLSPLFSLSSYAMSEEELKYKALKEEIEYLKERNRALEEKVDGLQSGGMPPGAPQAEKKDAWYDKIQVEVKKPGDGLKIKTKDGNYSMRFRLRSQLQLSVTDEDGVEDTATSFRVRRLRLAWDGNVFRPWFLYTVQVDALDDIILRDAFVDFAYSKVFAPRVGQYKVPFHREELNSSSELQLVERSILTDEFGWGRDIGAGVYGVLGNWIVYGAGVFNGNGRNATSADSSMLYAARVQFMPCCGELDYKQGSFPVGGDYSMEPNFGEDKPQFAFAVAAAGIPGLKIESKTPDNNLDDRFAEIGTIEADVISATADVNFKWSRLSAEGDYFWRKISPDEPGLEDATDQGFRGQAGVFLMPEFIEVAGRFGYIIYDDDIDGRDTAMEITPGVNVYLSKSHKWKLQFSYTMLQEEDTAGEEVDSNIFRAQLQAYF